MNVCLSFLRVQMSEPFRHPFTKQGGCLFMVGVYGNIQRGFTVITLEGQVSAAKQQGANDIHVAVLRRRMERGESALFTHIRRGAEFQEHLDDPEVTPGRR